SADTSQRQDANFNANLTAAGSTCTDAAGNNAAAKDFGVRIDKSDPVTTDNADSNFHNTAQTITLSPTDTGGSGIASTEYKVDPAPTSTTRTTVSIQAPADHSNDGPHATHSPSTDTAGNNAATNNSTVKIDTTDPVTTDNADSNFHNTAQTITLSPTDTGG